MIRTKNIIADTFWQLLEEKPYNKITVQAIADRCQLNRNTFYYYFHDIPDLLEYAVKQDTDEILEKYIQIMSPIDCIQPLIEHCLERKTAILHIYRSVQREQFVAQIERLTLYVAEQYIDVIPPSLSFSKEDRELFVHFYKCTLVGVILDWLDDGMNYDLASAFTRMAELLAKIDRQKLWESMESGSR